MRKIVLFLVSFFILGANVSAKFYPINFNLNKDVYSSTKEYLLLSGFSEKKLENIEKKVALLPEETLVKLFGYFYKNPSKYDPKDDDKFFILGFINSLVAINLYEKNFKSYVDKDYGFRFDYEENLVFKKNSDSIEISGFSKKSNNLKIVIDDVLNFPDGSGSYHNYQNRNYFTEDPQNTLNFYEDIYFESFYHPEEKKYYRNYLVILNDKKFIKFMFTYKNSGDFNHIDSQLLESIIGSFITKINLKNL